jgi:virginiamycin B lyase
MRIALLFLSLPALSLAQQIAIVGYFIPTHPVETNGIVTGPDGALWFTQGIGNNGNSIGRITTAGTIKEFATVHSEPFGIAAGPDGALWFTSDKSIGRITTEGKMTEYPMPNPQSLPKGITAGPDGAMWFTEYIGKIGRITMDGVITEYPVSANHSGLENITAGPDGALWFTEFKYGKIGRITTAGAISEYPVPGTEPFGITAGPDGALWFTELSGNNIGRITTAGVISEYPVPTAQSDPEGITTGPDGALWFVESSGYKVGRITTSGIITEYPIPSDTGYPGALTLGPDGELWFTAEDSIGEALFVTAGLSVSPDTGSFRGNLTFTGSGFAANENVQIFFRGVGSPVLASATADPAGAFTAAARTPQAYFGPRYFLAKGQSSGKLAAASFSTTQRLILSPNSGPPGTTVTVSGYGYFPLENVSIYWQGTNLGVAETDGRGTATFTLHVPADAPAGVYAVKGVGQSGQAGAHFTVE